MPHCKRSHVESGNNEGLTSIKSNRRMKYLTEYEKEDGIYGGHVFAETWEAAEVLAKQKGEIVIGYIPPDCIDCERELELRETV